MRDGNGGGATRDLFICDREHAKVNTVNSGFLDRVRKNRPRCADGQQICRTAVRQIVDSAFSFLIRFNVNPSFASDAKMRAVFF